MERYFLFNDKNTYCDWNLILTAKDITPPEPKTNYIELDGMSGSLDLSDALTGEITYKDRNISATFWTDYGTRKDRERIIRELTAFLHGKKVKIIEPDDSDHYFSGRAVVKSVTNSLAYAEISIECTCEPWRYCHEETIREILGNSQAVINNNGVKTLTPIFSVVGSVEIVYNGERFALNDGRYQIPDVKLHQGVNVIGVTGDGVVKVSYREAEL